MQTASKNSWQIHLQGIVQSVGFRPTVKRVADRMGLNGFVRNLGNQGVEILLTSELDRAEQFIKELMSSLPELAEVLPPLLPLVELDPPQAASPKATTRRTAVTTRISRFFLLIYTLLEKECE